MNDSMKFPRWFSLLSGLFFISNLFVFGLATLLRPSLAFPDAGAAAVFPIQFFAVRHIAMAFPLLYGLVWRDVKTLTIMYTIFVTMSALDILLLGIYDYPIPILGLIPFIEKLPTWGSVLVGVGMFLVPIGLALKYLTGIKDK